MSSQTPEDKLVEKLSQNQEAEFNSPSESSLTVRLKAEAIAAFLRSPPKSKAGNASLPQTIRISGAIIEGHLNLEAVCGPYNSALPPLVFNRCIFLDPINIKGSRLSSVDIVDSCLVQIDGEDCRVEGSLLLERVCSSERPGSETGAEAAENWHGGRGPEKPSVVVAEAPTNITTSAKAALAGRPRPQGLCSVNLRGANIGGSIKILNSRLVAKPRRKDFQPSSSLPNFALVATGTVGGSIQFTERSAALGGLSFSGATIGGNLWLAGSKLIGVESMALMCQLATIRGFAGLRTLSGPVPLRFESIGPLSFMATSVGEIDLSGALLLASPLPTEDPDVLILTNADIGNLRLAPDDAGSFESRGTIHLQNARVKGSIFFNFAILKPASASETYPSFMDAASHGVEPVLAAKSLHVEGDMTFDTTAAYGQIDLISARIAGDLILNSMFSCSPTERPVEILMMTNTTVGRHLTIESAILEIGDWPDEIRNIIRRRAVTRARKMKLQFLKNFELLELLVVASIKTKDEITNIPEHENANAPGANKAKTPAILSILRAPNQACRLLNTDGGAILGIITKDDLDLSNDENAKAYLRFFASSVWGEAGGFYIVEPNDDRWAALPQPLKEQVKPVEVTMGKPIKVSANILYGTALFRSEFTIADDGKVAMTDDTHIGDGVKLAVRYEKPFKIRLDGDDTPGWFAKSEIPGQWSDMSIRDAMTALERAKGIEPYLTRPVINLEGAHVGVLNDNNGDGWPRGTRLKLESLTYDRLPSHANNQKAREIASARHHRRESRRHKRVSWSFPKMAYALHQQLKKRGVGFAAAVRSFVRKPSSFKQFIRSTFLWLRRVEKTPQREADRRKSRADWLMMQYEDHRPSKAEFHPQPYEQLAKAYRDIGQFDESNHILILRWAAYRQSLDNWIYRLLIWVFRWTFSYGLSPSRALCVFAICVLLGWGSFNWANHNGMLVLDLTADKIAEKNEATSSLCGGQIDPLIYALDVFVPLLDLRQEQRCTIRSTPKIVPSPSGNSATNIVARTLSFVTAQLHNPSLWVYAKAAYAVLGWIVTSLTILTLSGTLRRQFER